MRRRLLGPLTVLALTFAISGAAFAFPTDDQPGAIVGSDLSALITSDDVFSTADLTLVLAPAAPMMGSSNGTEHYGPYTTPDTDSGCGVDPWNNETFDRHFTVKSNHDGTFTVVEQFKDGPAGVATVNAGITGSMHGYFIISNVGAQTSHSPFCDAVGMTNAGCNTTKFINTHFTFCYPVSCQVGTFFFHYAAGDQGLVEHEWKNASPDRGGNNGDISSVDPD
jgi:hypothetical protein